MTGLAGPPRLVRAKLLDPFIKGGGPLPVEPLELDPRRQKHYSHGTVRRHLHMSEPIFLSRR